MRSRYTIVPVLALGLCFGAWGQAQTAAPQKIAFIDMQGALLQTKDGQKAAAELRSKFGPKEQEFQKRQQDLAAKTEQYRKTENTMSLEAKAAADRDIQALTKNLQRDADDTKADFQAEENRLLGGIMQKMQTVYTKYANDNQITMVVDASSQPNNLLYADQSLNITAAVIALYDKSADTPASPPAAQTPKPPAAAAPKKTTPPTTPGPK